MKPITALKELMLKEKMKTSSLPVHAIPINTWQTAKPEIREKKRTAAWINLHEGTEAHIVENRAKRIDNRKQYVDTIGLTRTIGSVEFRPSDVENGYSDLRATIKGRSFFLELKRHYKKGKDRQSPDQVKFQAKVERAGALYIIFAGFDHFYKEVWPIIYNNPYIQKHELPENLR